MSGSDYINFTNDMFEIISNETSAVVARSLLSVNLNSPSCFKAQLTFEKEHTRDIGTSVVY